MEMVSIQSNLEKVALNDEENEKTSDDSVESIQSKLEKVALSDEENEKSSDDSVKSKGARVKELAFFYDENVQVSTSKCILERYGDATKVKAALLSHLKELVELSRALKLCDFLIKALKKHDRCSAGENCNDDHDYEILCGIQNLVKEPIDEMVEIIVVALDNKRWDEFPTKQKLKLLLMSVPGEDCIKPAEYLNRLIESTRKLVCIFISPDVEDRESHFDVLREFLIMRGISRINSFFGLMFVFGINKFNFSPKEGEHILRLMLQAMPYTGELIKKSIFFQWSSAAIGGCRKRSALQFTIELFDPLSENSEIFLDILGTLNAVIEYLDDLSAASVDIAESEDSDEYLDDLSASADIAESEGFDDECGGALDTETKSVDAGVIDDDDDYLCYPEYETLDDFIENGGNRVPKEHTWWEAYRKKHFPDH